MNLDAPSPWRLCEDGDGREIEALAVPYDETVQLMWGAERIGRGAVDVAALPGRPLLWRHDEPIGLITAAKDTDAGPVVRARVSAVPAGDNALTLVRDGAVRGVSIGFDPLTSRQDGPVNVHTSIHVRELSLTPTPAYSSAAVLAVRERSTMPATTTDTEPAEVREARQIIDTLDGIDLSSLRDVVAERREWGERVTALEQAAKPGVAPLSEYRSFGEYAKAVADGTEKRVWVDQITPNNPGVMANAWLKDVKGIVDNGRPAIQALGGARSLPDGGMNLQFPYFDGVLNTLVAAQATQKTEIASVRVDIKAGTSVITTFAGGSDLSLQIIQRSDPSYVDAYLRILTAAYSVVTDAAFVAKIVAGSGATAVLPAAPTLAQVRTFIESANLKVTLATGAPASAWIVGTTVYTTLLGVVATTQTDFFIEATSLMPTLDPNADPTTNVVTNGLAAGFHEQGPFTISDDVVSKLGRDYAVYGYASSPVYVPQGVVTASLTTALSADEQGDSRTSGKR